MELSRAFTYVFRDQHWISKLGEIGLLSVLCPTPVMGLVPLCALLGYFVEIVHNVAHDDAQPLPVWDHIGEDVKKGVHVLVALLIYHMPPILVLSAIYHFRPTLALGANGDLPFIAFATAYAPLLILYLLAAWPIFAIGLLQYAETWEPGEFYHWGRLCRTIQNNAVITAQWLISAMAANVILVLLTPALLLGVVLFLPVHGYLLGKFGRRLAAAKSTFQRAAA